MSMTVASIYRYPIKGLSAEELASVVLAPAQCIPHDRRFALANSTTRIDPTNPDWQPKTRFFMLMRNEKLARLHTRFDEQSGIVTIEHRGQVLLSACITDIHGRRSIEAFFAGFLAEYPEAPPQLVEAPGHTFSDAKQKPNSTTYKYISLVNLASVRALELAAQVTIDPIRFRANIYFEGGATWNELNWVGTEISIGGARLRVVSPITRCPATCVNPETAERDLDIPRLLLRDFGHNYMGIYAEVIDGGLIATNDLVAQIC